MSSMHERSFEGIDCCYLENSFILARAMGSKLVPMASVSGIEVKRNAARTRHAQLVMALRGRSVAGLIVERRILFSFLEKHCFAVN